MDDKKRAEIDQIIERISIEIYQGMPKDDGLYDGVVFVQGKIKQCMKEIVEAGKRRGMWQINTEAAINDTQRSRIRTLTGYGRTTDKQH